MYKGYVIDRCNDDVTVCVTRQYNTYEEAHHAAEKSAKRRGIYKADRYSIKISEGREN